MWKDCYGPGPFIILTSISFLSVIRTQSHGCPQPQGLLGNVVQLGTQVKKEMNLANRYLVPATLCNFKQTFCYYPSLNPGDKACLQYRIVPRIKRDNDCLGAQKQCI